MEKIKTKELKLKRKHRPECNVCMEKKTTVSCFTGCTYKICEDCLVEVIKVGAFITYKCPQCRSISDFSFVYKSFFGDFCLKNEYVMIKILEKYTKKYTFHSESGSNSISSYTDGSVSYEDEEEIEEIVYEPPSRRSEE